jgi:hypothetical protein
MIFAGILEARDSPALENVHQAVDSIKMMKYRLPGAFRWRIVYKPVKMVMLPDKSMIKIGMMCALPIISSNETRHP